MFGNGELIFRRGSEIELRAFDVAALKRLPGFSALAAAISVSKFAGSHRDYRLEIIRRFAESGAPIALSAAAIRQGWSSPSAFKHRRVLRALERELGLC